MLKRGLLMNYEKIDMDLIKIGLCLDFWFIVIRANHIDYCEICKMERDLNVQ